MRHIHNLIIYKFDGEPDTLRGVSPVRRKGRVDLLLKGNKATRSHPTLLIDGVELCR